MLANLPFGKRYLGSINGVSLIALVIAIVTSAVSFLIADTDWATKNTVGLGWVTVAQYLALSLCMFVVWKFGPQSNRLKDFVGIIAIAIIVRAILVPVNPYTSNDVDRYLFDGKVALSGFDPYRTNHNAPTLKALRAEWPTPEEHAKYPTLYPPGAIGLYALSAASGADNAALVWKSLSFFASALTVIFMALVLLSAGNLKHLSLVALSPILIFEAGVGAHIDAFSTLAVAASLYAYQRKLFVYAGVAIGLGTLSKLLPVLLLLPLFFSMNKLRDATKLVIAALATIGLGYAIAIVLGMQPIGSTPVFFEKWRNAAPLFDLLNIFLSGYTLVFFIALITVGAFVIVTLWTWNQSPKNEKNTLLAISPALQWVLIVPLLLSPVVFPWYLMVLVPLFALRPTFFLSAWFTLLPLSYLVLNKFACCGIWAPLGWTNYLLAVGLVLGLLFDQLFLSCKPTESCSHGQVA